MKLAALIGYWLVVIGGINWGLVGIGWFVGGSNFNVVHSIFGFSTELEGAIYVLVGLAAVWMVVMTKGKPSM